MARNSSAMSPGCAGRVSVRGPIEDRPACVEPLPQAAGQAAGLDHPPFVGRLASPGGEVAWLRPHSGPFLREVAGQRNSTVGWQVSSRPDRQEPMAASTAGVVIRLDIAEAVAEEGVDEVDEPGTLRKFSVRRSRPGSGNSDRHSRKIDGSAPRNR